MPGLNRNQFFFFASPEPGDTSNCFRESTNPQRRRQRPEAIPQLKCSRCAVFPYARGLEGRPPMAARRTRGGMASRRHVAGLRRAGIAGHHGLNEH